MISNFRAPPVCQLNDGCRAACRGTHPPHTHWRPGGALAVAGLRGSGCLRCAGISPRGARSGSLGSACTSICPTSCLAAGRVFPGAAPGAPSGLARAGSRSPSRVRQPQLRSAGCASSVGSRSAQGKARGSCDTSCRSFCRLSRPQRGSASAHDGLAAELCLTLPLARARCRRRRALCCLKLLGGRRIIISRFPLPARQALPRVSSSCCV